MNSAPNSGVHRCPLQQLPALSYVLGSVENAVTTEIDQAQFSATEKSLLGLEVNALKGSEAALHFTCTLILRVIRHST